MTEPSKDLVVVRDLELDKYARLGQWLAASESGDQTPNSLGASAALRLFYAHELGLPPLAAAELSVIKGRLFVQAKLLRALAVRHGYRVVREKGSNDTTCTAVLVSIDTGEEIGRATFTIEDAKKAGLVRDRSAWVSHPARMLWARASKFVLDDYAPEVTLGLATDDEADEIASQPTPPPSKPEPGPEPEEGEFEPLPPSEEQKAAFYQPQNATPRQIGRIRTLLVDKQGVTDEADQLEIVAHQVKRELTTLDELGMAEATHVISTLHEQD